MLVTLRYDSNSPFLPEMKLPIFVRMFDKDKTKELYRLILNKERWILDNVKPYPEGDDPTWLTNRLYGYNLFNFSDEFPVLNELKEFLYQSYVDYCKSVGAPVEKVYVQCWANIIRNNGRAITDHAHADAHIGAPVETAYVSGSMCLNDVNSSTMYRNPFLEKKYIDIKNHAGENIMFPSWVIHRTTENNTPLPRLSIAYDIVTESVYNIGIEEQKKNFILLG